MRDKANLVLVDTDYYFVLQDGTEIERDKIGWVANDNTYSYDSSLEKFGLDDALFVINNNIQCEIEMMDEFTNPEQYENVPLFEGERKIKFFKGKIIIHYL